MYNQPPFNPSAPPAPPSGGSNKKILFGVLGAVGCFGLLFMVALAAGAYFYFSSREKPTFATVNTNSNNAPPPVNSNGNSNSNANSNGGTTGNNSSSQLRAAVKPKVGKFNLVKVETMTTTPPTFPEGAAYDVEREANAVLTRIIMGASPSAALYARYRAGNSDDFNGVDHRLVHVASEADAGALMESVAGQLKGMGFTERRRTSTVGEDRKTVLGSKIYLQNREGQDADEVVLWTNRSYFMSAFSGRAGNATEFEKNTAY